MPIRALVLAFFLAAPAHAAPVRIKLGTLAPQGSTWHQLLQEMAQKWSQASNGQVELKIYAGGTQGNEGEMIRKISIGQLHAASITAIGLHEITPEPQLSLANPVTRTVERFSVSANAATLSPKLMPANPIGFTAADITALHHAGQS